MPRPDGAQVPIEVTLRRWQHLDGARFTSATASSHSRKAWYIDLDWRCLCLHGLSDPISRQGWQGDYYINDFCVSLSPAHARHDLEGKLPIGVMGWFKITFIWNLFLKFYFIFLIHINFVFISSSFNSLPFIMKCIGLQFLIGLPLFEIK